MTADGRTCSRSKQVGGGHGAGQTLQRGEADAQQQAIGDEHRGQPPVRTAASVRRTGVETVTGPSSRAVAPISTTALSRKIRQNKGIDTASVQSPSSPLIPA